MAYQIVCVEKTHLGIHHHITAVGTGRNPARAENRWTVAEVRRAITVDATRFYTVSPSTGQQADVEPYDCACGIETIRTNPDQVTDNNLDNLRACRFTS